MSKLMSDLTFDYVSEMNWRRAKHWHGDKQWSLSDWAVALAGETGELCNIVKKLNRIRDELPGNKKGVTAETLKTDLLGEIADIYLYLDLFASAAHLDLAAAIKIKFNEVSKRIGYIEMI